MTSNVYRKTERGQLEISTRKHKLAPRLRAALVLVDGRRSQMELAPMIGSEAPELLHSLLAAGFIEPVEGSGSVAPTRLDLPLMDDAVDDEDHASGYAPTQPLETLGAPTAAPAPAGTPGAGRPALAPLPAVAAVNLATTKQMATQWLSRQLGASADSANRRIERCDHIEALGSALLVARSVVEQQLGAQAANTFEAEMFAALRRGAAGS